MSAFTSFTISQAFLGAPLQFYPVLGSLELEELIEAFVTGSASKQEKMSEVTLDFFNNATVDLNTGALVRHYNVFPTSTETWSPTQSSSSGFSPVIYTPSPSATSSNHINLADSGYGSFSSSSAQSTPAMRNINAPAAASSVVTGRVAKKTKKSSEMRLPGFSIMTKDGVDVTNSAGRGTKTKEQREHAHLMRIMKACEACKKKKIRCDPSHRRSQTDMSRTSTSSTSATHPSSSSSSGSSSRGTSSSLSTPPTTTTTPAAALAVPAFSNSMDDFVLFPEDVSSWDLFNPTNTNLHANPNFLQESDWDMGQFDLAFDANAGFNVNDGFYDGMLNDVHPDFFHSQFQSQSLQTQVLHSAALQSPAQQLFQEVLGHGIPYNPRNGQEDVSLGDAFRSQRPEIEPSDPHDQLLRQQQRQQLQPTSSASSALNPVRHVQESEQSSAQEDAWSHQLPSPQSRNIATNLMDWSLVENDGLDLGENANAYANAHANANANAQYTRTNIRSSSLQEGDLINRSGAYGTGSQSSRGQSSDGTQIHRLRSGQEHQSLPVSDAESFSSDQAQSQSCGVDHDTEMENKLEEATASSIAISVASPSLFVGIDTSSLGIATFSVFLFCCLLAIGGAAFAMTSSSALQAVLSMSMTLSATLASSALSSSSSLGSFVRLSLMALFVSGSLDGVIVQKAKALLAVSFLVLDGSFLSSLSPSASCSVDPTSEILSSVYNSQRGTTQSRKHGPFPSTAVNRYTSSNSLDFGLVTACNRVQTPWVLSLLRELSSDSDSATASITGQYGDVDGDVVMS